MRPHKDKELIAVVHTYKSHEEHPGKTHLHSTEELESGYKKPEFNSYDPWLNQDGYKEYIEKHDHHFSRKLAIWAIDRMENDNGSDYHKMPEGVKAMWLAHNLILPKTATWGDATYSFNMHYADYYGDPLKTEEEVLRESYKDITDKDGYPGKIFNRWLSDIIYKGIEVPWKDLI